MASIFGFAFACLLVLKLAGLAQIGWFTVFIPLIVAVAIPVFLIVIAAICAR